MAEELFTTEFEEDWNKAMKKQLEENLKSLMVPFGDIFTGNCYAATLSWNSESTPEDDESRMEFIPTQIIYNPPATICVFPDGTKVIARVHDEEFSEEFGVMACIIKKIFGTRSAFKRLVAAGYRQPKSEPKVKKEKEK